MSKNEKARSTAATVKRAEAAAFSGAAASFKSVRELSKQVERERRAGQPICASVSGEHRGYFIGDAEELRLYLHSLDRRLREVRRTRDACNATLCRMSGQTVLEGWNG